ncbi:hypothetical protein KR054_004937 [Drosophila jambulina]|nr:hypothetical protein KR054_004937 [Drosophila jambulina]
MFENISFLFLFAMALLSWAVLCLQHEIEFQRRSASDYHVELYTELPKITFEPKVSHNPPDPGPAKGTYDFAMSFWGILGITFGLSKLLQLAERQAKKYLKSHETLKLVNTKESQYSKDNFNAEQNLLSCEDNQEALVPVENVALREQLNVLETHCLEMRELLHELRRTKSSSSQGSVQSGAQDIVTMDHSEELLLYGKEPSVTASTHSFQLTPSPSQHSQNIYITNSHIHIRGPIFCSDNNFSMELSRQAAMYARKQSEFVQVWGKYITDPKERPMIAGSMRCHNILM